jgi:ribosome-associated toxin RatA of RatAB toxin-antitoxin module
MTTSIRTALVPYTTRQMYELVSAIEDYPRFLPWCSQSKVLLQDEQEVVASLTIAWAGLHKSFTTRNVMSPNEGIKISLVEGPLKRLDGIWSFTALGTEGCKIELDMEFEFSGGFLDRLVVPIFDHIGNSLVDAFCKRAGEVYGG